MTEQNKKTNNILVQGSILAAASLIVRFIGMLYRIPMTAILGEKAIGYYNIAFEFYDIALLLSTYSLPLAVSKLVSARAVQGQHRNARKVFMIAIGFGLVVGNIAMFACELLKQKEALCEAIREAKISQKFDAGLMSDVNATRRTVATVLQTLSSYEENTSVLEDEGRVWMVNNEGTQVPYQCDKRITETPTFDKDLIKGLVDKTFAEADTASSRVDLAMVEDCVRWNPSFSVNESFKDVYRKYVRSAGL